MDAYLDEAAPPAYIGGVKDPIRALAQLVEAIAPGADAYVFTRRRSYVRILHQNDYIIEKAIICCVWCLSKWLGRDRFPQGIFEWPPLFPDVEFLLPPVEDDGGDAIAVAATGPGPSSGSS